MQVGALAESGLSECANAGTCGPSTSSMIVVLVGFLALCAWAATSMVATASIVNTHPSLPRRPLWLLATWVVPLIGASAWWLYLRRVKFTGHNDG